MVFQNIPKGISFKISKASPFIDRMRFRSCAFVQQNSTSKYFLPFGQYIVERESTESVAMALMHNRHHIHNHHGHVGDDYNRSNDNGSNDHNDSDHINTNKSW